jgi:hypothetical protein
MQAQARENEWPRHSGMVAQRAGRSGKPFGNDLLRQCKTIHLQFTTAIVTLRHRQHLKVTS